MSGPSKVLAVYWTGWNQGGAMTNVDTDYNVILPFACTRQAGTGTLSWGYGTIAGMQEARKRGQKVCLSTGGAGQGINFNSRTISQQFVDSFVKIAASLGGVDGIDFNTFEADAAPNLPEYQWICAQLRSKFGPNFFIQSPPAPWSDRDKTFCKAMLASGSMDWCGPQFYDGPGLADKAYILKTTAEWVSGVAGGDASKIIVGFGISTAANYMTNSAAVDTFKAVKAQFPNIRGAFLWERSADANAGWAFANAMGPLVGSSLSGDGGTTTPPPTETVTIGSSTYPFKGTNLARGVDELVAYTRTATQVASPANQWGTEATVVNGKVTATVNRVSGAPASPIPEGGLVLAGHGAAQQFLDANATVGAAARVPGAPKPPTVDPKIDVTINGQTRKIDGVNAPRDTDQLIQYTPAQGNTTGTNEYGTEVAVVGGKVTNVVDDTGNLAIPSGGYVLSGHGASQSWLQTNAKVGTTVKLSTDVVTTPPTTPPANPTLPSNVSANATTAQVAAALNQTLDYLRSKAV